MTKPHNRRPGYWPYYELSTKTKEDFMDESLIDIVSRYPHPNRRLSPRGCHPTHSREKLDFACFKMTSSNSTYQYAVDELKKFRHVWDEPIPTRKEIVTHMQTIDPNWLDFILATTGFSCLEALTLSNATAPLGCDSSAFETTRYSYAPQQNMTLDNFITNAASQNRTRIYLKYHITAILGHQIILAAITTPSNVHDSTILPVMIKLIQKYGFEFYGRSFLADRGYDAEENYKIIFNIGMRAIIKQRKYFSQYGKPAKDPETYRQLAALLFDPSMYAIRALIEGIFGAEETKRHQLQCRFLLETNRLNFSKFRAIAWNLGVLHRFNCANFLGIPIPSYGVSKDVSQNDNSIFQQTLA